MADREYLNVVSWERVHRDVFALANLVEGSGYRTDLMIGIAYGGVIPSNLLYFALPETRYVVAYPGDRGGELVIPFDGIEGKNVLLVDDLAFTGDSLHDIKRQVLARSPKELRTACLYCSVDCKDVDYVVRRLKPEERIVFPWYTRLSDDGIDVMKFKNRFGKYEPNI